jgi:protein-L-isoaspartate(D-aspartate) O-methyltransferase
VTAAEQASAQLVDALCAAGRIRSPVVERAFRAVPRHLFLPTFPLSEAYADEAVPTRFAEGAATSSASQPSMMAIMLEQLELRPGHRVLEIGAGTGYNAALMATVVGEDGAVTAVDIDQDLVDTAAEHLAAAAEHLAAVGSAKVRLVCGDGALGQPDDAPYDRIVLTVGSDDVRPEWVAQLAPGGRLLLPLAVRGSQLSVALDLGEDGVLRSDSVQSCMFIRLRGIGSGSTGRVALAGTGLVVELPPDGAAVDPARVGAALGEPARPIPAPLPLRQADIWDGFGLWLALTEPRAIRLVSPPKPEEPEQPEEAERDAAADDPGDEDADDSDADGGVVAGTAAASGRGMGTTWFGARLGSRIGARRTGSATPLTDSNPPAGTPALSGELLPVGPTFATVALTTLDGPPALAAVVQPASGGQAIRPYGPAGLDLAAALVGSMQAWAAVGRPGAPDWRITVVPGEPSTPVGPGVVAKRHSRVLAELRGR